MVPSSRAGAFHLRTSAPPLSLDLLRSRPCTVWKRCGAALSLEVGVSLSDEHLAEIRSRHAAATRGPWCWFGYATSYQIYLSGAGGDSVMEFRRWGMQRAQPLFADARNVLRDVVDIMRPDTSPERKRITEIINPNAQAIAHSWSDVEALLSEVDRLRSALAAKEAA